MSKLVDMAVDIQELHDAAAIDDVANWLTYQFNSSVSTQTHTHVRAGTGGVGGEIPRQSYGENTGVSPEIWGHKALVW